jgi:hypothetical protein
MCDYSLCGIPNRLAAEGEELVVHKFSTGSMGLASPADLPVCEAKESPKGSRQVSFWQGFWERVKSFFEPSRPPATAPAVCIPPGAQLILKDIPADMQRQCRVSQEESVFFTQLSVDVNSYRDAIRFNNGFQLRLQDLRQGMRVQVLSLAGVEEYTPVMSEALR